MTVAAIRYWVFAAFVLATAFAHPGGIRAVARSQAPRLQVARGLLLAGEMCIVVLSFVLLGLIGTHAIFAVYPLLVAALAGPVLGQFVGGGAASRSSSVSSACSSSCAPARRCSARWR